ncbi:MAG: hypothetical protein B6I36_06385 [Desulfobacteraceae bacterium 4572_35.1]|nr:MAG: hypothetical protein B6I36_06385 [Desulfobacteraceae bacterium 4572_35.1]
MYRTLTLVAVLLLTLTACGKDNNAQTQQPTSTQIEATSLSHAIANKPVVVQNQTQVAQAPLETSIKTTEEESATTNNETSAAIAPETVEEPTTSIVSVQLENKFGSVLIPHSLHVKLYYCIACHGDNKPGKIEMTKKQYHATCRGCHAKLKSGPTKCRSCHQR